MRIIREMSQYMAVAIAPAIWYNYIRFDRMNIEVAKDASLIF